MASRKSYFNDRPGKSVVLFLLGVFFLFSTVGLATDMSEMGRQPTLRFVLSLLAISLFAICYAAAGITLKGQWWKAVLPIFVVHFFVMYALNRWLPSAPSVRQMGAEEIARLGNRLNWEALAIIAAMGLGYACFVYVSITEGRRYFRVHAELALAKEIHQVLVPTIEAKLGGFEFYGLSSASGEVGGDLIDVAGPEDHCVAYVADVSGHGVAPGVVMGMVKSASRMLLTTGGDSGELMPRLNEVLYPLKKPDMFVTFCFVAKSRTGLRVGLAGHPSILQYSARTGEVRPLECPNMPLGILPDGEFQTSEIAAESGDVFALYTDGLLETANAAGEEFGLKRLMAHLQRAGNEPLPAICRSLQESVAQHGAQFDDQSLLLIRKL
jgi:hypothetical protein